MYLFRVSSNIRLLSDSYLIISAGKDFYRVIFGLLFGYLSRKGSLSCNTCRDFIKCGSSIILDECIFISNFKRLLFGHLSRNGALSCHTCRDTGPRELMSHYKDRLEVAFYDKQGVITT